MARIYFEEVQAFRESSWVWTLVITILLAALLPIMYGLYQQLGTGVPWGNKSMTDSDLIFVFLFTLMSTGIGAFVVLSSKLEVKIDEQGIHYRYFPVTSRWQLIIPDQIASYTLEKRFNIFESGFGYFRSLFRKIKSYRIRGSQHLSLKLKNGYRILLGTQNPEGLEQAMKKLMHSNEMI
jgi:hypothetical protein